MERTYIPSDDRPSGVPPKGSLGESKKELWALVGAGIALLVIALAFWLEASP
jgi:hypothetical protein